MFYTIYKTTNLINGKFYIGKHKTKNLNDGYMGSGKLLKRAISKYGIDNFHKEILHVCESEKQMNALEKILVVPDSELNYNLCSGGHGGFGYINDNSIGVLIQEQRRRNPNLVREASIIGNQKKKEKAVADPNWWSVVCKNNSKAQKKRYENGAVNPFKGKSHNQSYKDKMSCIMKEKTKGTGNSQYGTCWITNGLENRKIKKEELDSWIELGYNKGRKVSIAGLL